MSTSTALLGDVGAARLGIAGVPHTSAVTTVRELDERFGIRAAA